MKIWLNINRSGGLGNRLFSRAHVFAAAKEYGATVVDWGLADCLRYFPDLTRAGRLPVYPGELSEDVLRIAGRIPDNDIALGALRLLWPRWTSIIGPMVTQAWNRHTREVIDFSSEKFRRAAESHEFLVLNGFKMTCPAWVEKYDRDIRSTFALPRPVVDRWAKLQDGWHQIWDASVAVHMRASDFKTAQGGRYYLTPAEYVRLIRRIRDLDLSRTLFVIFSDENFYNRAAYENLTSAFEGLNWIYMHGDQANDLAGISSCDRVIGPMSSTYSRWAAFARGRPWVGVWRGHLESDDQPIAFQDKVVPWAS